MKLAIASDHGGFELKESLKTYLHNHYPNITLQDMGTHTSESVDYPDYAQKVAQSILDKINDAGILICGTGIGISIAANRFKGIRAAVVHNTLTAQMAKAHNNANILCLGGRIITPSDANKLVKTWLETKFEGDRHQRRLDKIDQI